MESNKVFTSLEKLSREKFPFCVKTLLIKCAYDRMLSLQEINGEKLRRMEQHIDSNREMLMSLNCCNSDIYKNQSEFRFLPGHESTILGIPTLIEQLKQNRKKAVQIPNKKPAKSDEQLKKSLVACLAKYPSKNGLVLPENVISNRNIIDFKHEKIGSDEIVRCGFSCPFCVTVIPVVYKMYWRTSNATGHLKSHIATQLASDDPIVMMQAVIVENSEN